mmetsp:Transcript_57762/g.133413  ORF Transcript_57762/g.133413 Transcript_57762/m.133413 type:complete len:255 (+) Transcript_57762:642-1406(+)
MSSHAGLPKLWLIWTRWWHDQKHLRKSELEKGWRWFWTAWKRMQRRWRSSLRLKWPLSWSRRRQNLQTLIWTAVGPSKVKNWRSLRSGSSHSSSHRGALSKRGSSRRLWPSCTIRLTQMGMASWILRNSQIGSVGCVPQSTDFVSKRRRKSWPSSSGEKRNCVGRRSEDARKRLLSRRSRLRLLLLCRAPRKRMSHSSSPTPATATHQKRWWPPVRGLPPLLRPSPVPSSSLRCRTLVPAVVASKQLTSTRLVL